MLVGQSIGAAAALRAALDRPDRASGVVLAHSLGGLKHPELATLVKADRAAAEKLPVLDRLLTPEFRAQRPDLAFLFRQMGTFNTAKMADLRNLGSDGPTLGELACSTRRSAGSWPRSPRVRSRAPDAPARRPPTGAGRTPTRICGSCSSSRSSTRENPGVSQTASSLVATYSPSESFGEVLGERSAPGRRRTNLHRQS